jgi:hypothetical protein
LTKEETKKRVISWDLREDVPIEELNNALTDLGFQIMEVDTHGADAHAAVIGPLAEMTKDQAQEFADEYFGYKHATFELDGGSMKEIKKSLQRLQKEYKLREDWHEPDEESIDVKMIKGYFDNAMGAYEGCGEAYVILLHNNKEIAKINLATLFAIACM